MATERESIGTFVLRRITNPETAEGKIRYWPLGLVLIGALLIFRIGLDLPAKPTGEFPFIAWEKPTTVGAERPINDRALLVGGILIALGLIGSIRLIPLIDKEKDKHWPQVKADNGPGFPILFVETPTIVDAARVNGMLEKFGNAWPPTTIRWPYSTQRLIDAAGEILGSQHRLDLSNRKVQPAFAVLPQLLAAAAAAQERCAASLPEIAQRLHGLPPETLSRTVQRLLVLVNYKAFNPVYRALTEIKVVAPEIAIPKIWEFLFGDDNARITLYGTNDTGLLKRAILVGIGDKATFGPHGSVISVEGRGYSLRHRVSAQEAGADILAEIEAFVITSGGELPDRYQGDLLFSKIGPATSSWLPGLGEVSVDPDLDALGERYRAERTKGKPRSSEAPT